LIESAAASHLSVVSVEEGVLRYEYGNPVAGLIAVFGS
jgi:hypothetical protein